MATVSVRIPTVLRPAANGQSAVNADGQAVGEVVKSLIAEYPGLEANLIDDGGSSASSSTSTSTTRTSASSTSWRHRSATATRSPSCPPWPAAEARHGGLRIGARSDRRYPDRRRISQLSPESERADPGQAREPESGRIGQGPHRAGDGRRGRGRGRARAGHDRDRAVVGQHRHRLAMICRYAATPQDRAARERDDRAPPAARSVRGRDHPSPGAEGSNGAVRWPRSWPPRHPSGCSSTSTATRRTRRPT